MFRILPHTFRIIYLVFVLFSLETRSQALPCGSVNEPAENIQQRERRIFELKKLLSNAQISATPIYLPIKAHIIRRTDATGGLSLSDLNAGLVEINKKFTGSNIQFYLCGNAPNYVDNTAFFDFNNSQESAICGANDVNNAINIYFPNSITSGGTPVAGYAYFPGASAVSNRVFLQSSSVTDFRTLAHELGHYFNLYHTFQGSNGAVASRELVTRSSSPNPIYSTNCGTQGDLLCDTPADPFGRDSDSVKLTGCSYIGNALDRQGQLYTPLLSNMMSYFPTTCGNLFTTGQQGRMADGLTLRLDAGNQYTLNCPSAVTGANVPNNLAGTVGATGVTITYADNSSNETGFIIERSTTSPTDGFAAIGSTNPNVTTYLDQSTTAFTQYFYRIRASNSKEYSAVFTITTNLNYCIPLYTNSCTSVPMIIDDFILSPATGAAIISNTSSGCSASSYGNFTSVAYNVTAGQTYNFTARAVRLGGTTFYDQHIAIWIDYDRNGIFDPAERVFQSDGTAMKPRMNPTSTGSITIPNVITVGIVRLRIRSGFASFGQVTDPCATMGYGEAEDYNLNISITTPPTITTGTVLPNPVCAGQAINVSFTTTLTSGTYKVQLSDNTGNNFAAIPTIGTGSPLTATLPSTVSTGSGYQVRVVSTSPAVTGSVSGVFTINAIPAAPTAPTPINYCTNQTATALTATGNNLKWYNVASGGTGSTTAPTPSTASAATTSYWVSQTVGNCESSRSKIDVVVSQTPTAPTATTLINYCTNQTATALTATGNNLKWYNVASAGTSSGTAPTPSTASAATTSYWVSQTINNCESSRTKIDVIVAQTPAAPTAPSPLNYCTGQTATVLTATGSNLKWYNMASAGTSSGIAPTPSTASAGTTSFWVSQTVGNCESSRTKIDVIVAQTPAAPAAPTPINYQQNQTASPLTATGTNLLWYTVATNGTGSLTAPTPQTANTGTTFYYVSQISNGCESSRAIIQVNVNPPATAAVCFDITVILEGPYSAGTMTTNLNQRGLLPGQTPIDVTFGVRTPAGQPYKVTPWNYLGTEKDSIYPSTVVDWVLVSLRTNPTNPATTVFRKAAWLLKTGKISFVTPCPTLNISQTYYVVVEHRNHIGAMSHLPVSVSSGNVITYNFTAQQSYIPPDSPAYGQRQLGAVFALFAADCSKNSFSQIDANDASFWKIDNGKIGRYSMTDFNLDGVPDANDNTMWRVNNGKFSGVNF